SRGSVSTVRRGGRGSGAAGLFPACSSHQEERESAARRSAQHHVKCPTETIQAEEGDDVTLRFDLDPRVNLEDYTLDVRRTDLDEVVHAYRHGKDLTDPQMERYRDRTTLIHEDLSRGIVTLQISSVQLKDSGPYRCFVLGLRAGCTTVLNVGKHEDFTT
uniref:Immunoglobulin domain-containing protein n=1 Tax=Seriola dumerili TaxID=41447 RepID=A0A3B4T6Z9_SERDU